MGYQAGFTNSSGASNVFIGTQAGYTNDVGSFNVFLGYLSGFNNTASYNSFIGYQAGNKNTTGTQNCFLGYNAGAANTTGNTDVFIGNRAGLSNLSGYDNIFIGNAAGVYNTTGTANVFIGPSSGVYNLTGGENVFVGESSGSNNTASFNTFIGANSGQTNTDGNSNTLLGYYAGSANIHGSGNIMVGDMTGESSTSLNNNVFLGSSSGRFSNGQDNVFIGNAAGYNCQGSHNVLIGYNAGMQLSDSNKLYIANTNTSDPLMWGDFSASLIKINGFLGIGNIIPSFPLDVKGRGRFISDGVSTTGFWFTKKDGVTNRSFIGMYDDNTMGIWGDPFGWSFYMNNDNGNVGIGSTPNASYKLYVGGSAWSTGSLGSSDARYKRNIVSLGNTLNAIMQLRGVTFEWRKDEFPQMNFDNGTQLGLIAQEVEKIFPELVKTDDNGYKAIAYDKLTAVLVEGMKEQQKQIETIQTGNDELKRENAALKAQLEQLIVLKQRIEKLEENIVSK